MSTVDERIVSMKIDNRQLLSGAKTSAAALGSLNKSVDNMGKSKGMAQFGDQTTQVSLRMKTLQVASITAISNITTKLMSMGTNLVKSFTIQPIKDGFNEYEKVLKSTQTIVANTGETAKRAGKGLDELNKYSDQTIYNFGQMADNIGKWTAAGVKLDPAIKSIKGLANTAALAGADANQLNTAMYQMSQMMASGTMRLMDWKSMENAGMGGSKIRDSLIATAKSMEVSNAAYEESTAKGEKFRDSLAGGWLTNKVFGKTMEVMAGRTLRAGELVGKTAKELKQLGWDGKRAGDTIAFTTEELEKMGYAKGAAKELNRLSQQSIISATKVKSFTQLIDVLKESIASGWAGIFKSLFGDLKQAGDLWTKVGQILGDAINVPFEYVGKMLKQWNRLGGYTAMWNGFGNIFQAIGNLLKPILSLFQGIVPQTKKASGGLVGFSKGFEKVTEVIEALTRGVSAISPIFKFFGNTISFVFGIVGKLAVLLAKMVGGTFNIVGAAINKLVGYVKVLWEEFNKLTLFTTRLKVIKAAFADFSSAISGPVLAAFKGLGDALGKLLSGDISGFKSALSGAFKNLGDIGKPFTDLMDYIKDNLVSIREAAGPAFTPLIATFETLVSGAKTAGKWLTGMFSSLKGGGGESATAAADKMSAATGSISDGAERTKQALNSMGDVISAVWAKISAGANWVVGAFGSFFGKVSGGAKGMDKLDFGAIINSIISGGAIVMIWQLTKTIKEVLETLKTLGDGFIKPIEGLTETLSVMQKAIKAQIIKTIAIAVALLAASIVVLSFIPVEKIGIGVGAIAAVMGMLVKSMLLMDKAGGAAQMAALSTTLVGMGSAIVLLAASVLIFGNMPTDILLKGAVSVAVAMGLLVAASLLLSKDEVSKDIAVASLAMIAFSVALNTMATAILAFGLMKPEVLSQGIKAVGVTLAILAGAAYLLSASGPALIGASAGLLVLSIALNAMVGTILLFAALPADKFAKGLGLMVVAIAALGAVAYVAALPLVILGAAFLMLGAGAMLAGIGVSLLGAGLAVLAVSGTAGIAVMSAAIIAFVGLLPLIAIQIASAFVSVLDTLAKAMPKILASLGSMLSDFVPFLLANLPKLYVIFAALLDTILQIIVDKVPDIVVAAMELVTGLLVGIEDKLPELAESARNLITTWLGELGKNTGAIATAAFEFIVGLLESIADAVEENVEPMVVAGRRIAWGLLSGIIKGLVPEPIKAGFSTLVTTVLDFFKGLLGIHSPSTVFLGFGKDIIMGLINGITSLVGKIISTVKTVVTKLITTFVNIAKTLPGKVVNVLSSLKDKLSSVITKAFDFAKNVAKTGVTNIIDVVTGLPAKIISLGSKMLNAGKNFMSKLFDGFKSGVGKIGGVVADIGNSIMNGIIDVINVAVSAINTAIPDKIKLPGVKDINLPDNPIPKVPRFAKGTDNAPRGMALVGEEGPELVSLKSGDRVLTNKNTRNVVSAMKTLSDGTKIVVNVAAPVVRVAVAPTVAMARDSSAKVNPVTAIVASATKKFVGLGATIAEATVHTKNLSRLYAAGLKLGGDLGRALIASTTAYGVGQDVMAARKNAYTGAAASRTATSVENDKAAKAHEAKAAALDKRANKAKSKAQKKKLKKAAKQETKKAAAEKKKSSQNSRKASAYENKATQYQKQMEAASAAETKRLEKVEREEGYKKAIAAKDYVTAANIDAEDSANAANSSVVQRQKALGLRTQADLVKKDAADETKAKRALAKKLKKSGKKGDKAKAAQLEAEAKALERKATVEANKLNTQALAAEKSSTTYSNTALAEAMSSAALQEKQNAKDLVDFEFDLKYEKMNDAEKMEANKQKVARKKIEADEAYAKANEELTKANNSTDAKAKAEAIFAGQQQLELAKSLTEEVKNLEGDISSSMFANNADMQALVDALEAPKMDVSSGHVTGASSMFEAYTMSIAATLSDALAQPQPSVNLTQNNYSPESLDSGTIYRNSKSLVAPYI